MAMILVPVLMILAVSFVDPILRSYRAAASDQKTVLAKTVADSMFEEALWQTRETGTGETTTKNFKKEYDFGTANGTWWVFGTPETDTTHLINGYYTVPSPGSGDAGGDYCSTREPIVKDEELINKQKELLPDIIDANFFPLQTGDVLEWPCHWGTLREGESMSIPLYVEEGGVVKNPADLQLNQFTLNIRSACNPAYVDQGPANRGDSYKDEICSSGERFKMDETNFAEVIVLWEITGEMADTTGNPTGEYFYLGPYMQTLFINSNITPLDINGYYTVPVLTQISNTLDQSGIHFNPIANYLNNNNSNPDFDQIHRPVLTFMVIHTLRDANNQQIPYVEYQFSAPAPTGGNPPVANVSKVVRVDVMVDGAYSKTIEKNIALPKATTGFVIQN